MKLGEYLEARSESENAFAKRAGVNQTTINRIVRGEQQPSLRVAVAISSATKRQKATGGGFVALPDLWVGDNP